jgi:hypothetical protein
MSDTNKEQFRTTTWPGEPVPLPTGQYLRPGRLVDDAGNAFMLGEEHYGTPEFYGPYGEVYLELAALDLEDDEAIASFYLRYGILGVCRNPRVDPDDAWDKAYFGFPGIPGFEDFIAPALAEHRQELGIGPWDETLQEFIFGANCVKDLVNSWRVSNGQASEDDFEWQAPVWTDNLPEEQAYSYWASPYWALGRGMGSGLEPFGPTIHWLWEEDEPGKALDPGRGGAHPTHRDVELSLYSILCLELFNHIAEGSSYRVCANETCGRFFVRQSGRALHGQHRSKGVKYCSVECAKAQAQRQYRRRNRKRRPPS